MCLPGMGSILNPFDQFQLHAVNFLAIPNPITFEQFKIQFQLLLIISILTWPCTAFCQVQQRIWRDCKRIESRREE